MLAKAPLHPVLISLTLQIRFFPTLNRQEKRVDKATLEMEPEYPPRYFDDLAKDLCTSEGHAIFCCVKLRKDTVTTTLTSIQLQFS